MSNERSVLSYFEIQEDESLKDVGEAELSIPSNDMNSVLLKRGLESLLENNPKDLSFFKEGNTFYIYNKVVDEEIEK